MAAKIAKLLSVACILSLGACAHRSEADKEKSDYESSAETRIKRMDKQIKNLEDREAQQLPGGPKEQLTAAVDNLKQKTTAAKAELTELDARGTDTWVDKKASVDQRLYDMDKAYSDALQTMAAH